MGVCVCGCVGVWLARGGWRRGRGGVALAACLVYSNEEGGREGEVTVRARARERQAGRPLSFLCAIPCVQAKERDLEQWEDDVAVARRHVGLAATVACMT